MSTTPTIGTSNTLNPANVERESFWLERLKNLQLLTIPYAKQVNSSQKSARSITSLPQELVSALHDTFPDRQLPDLMLAVFACYMARISGMTYFDLDFTDKELAHEIVDFQGLFTAYIPCRLDLDLERNFLQLSEAVREQIDFAKQDLSCGIDLATKESILNSLAESDGDKILPVAVTRTASLEAARTTPGFGKELTFFIPDRGRDFCWQYDPEILEEIYIERMWEQMITLLQSIVDRPQTPLIRLPLISETEKERIFRLNKFTEISSLENKCVQQLFEARVAQTPEAIAVTFQDSQLTYRELNERVNQLAHYLRDLGVAPDVLVGFCVGRSLEMIIGLLAILKAGGAYVPLDPAYPEDRLAYMVEDAAIPVLITQSKLAERLPENQAKVVLIDRDWDKISQCDRANPAPTNTGENTAYVIYTSGSTGKPKGVAISHIALSHFAQTAIVEYGILSSDRLLQFASINFDVAVEEIFPSLLCGSTIVVRTNEMISDLRTFTRACEELQLTVLNLPTAYWHTLANELARSDLDLPECVRLVIIGGEKVLPEQVRQWQKYVTKSGRRESLKLINSYGPTEATVSATLFYIGADTEIIGEVPIGRPFSHLQAYIIDRYNNLVPMGIPGELHLGGISLAKGYLNRPELTAEKFIDNFLEPDLATRLYKTGDLVRYLPDGNIEYIGRIDKQVKIRGFRIELGAIETVITQHPKIREAAVIAREDIPGDKRLVAYFVGKDVADSELRSFLKDRLPSYMLPAAFVRLDALPITPSGKIDRQALPAPEFGSSESSETAIAPRNETERKLAEIWQEVLKLPQIGVSDNFFELGGHSLLAVSLLTKIEQNFGRNVPLATFLSAATIEDLAKVLSQETISDSDSLLFEIRKAGTKPPLFLINAMGTGMLAYKLLSSYLDSDIPVYGIRAVGMDDDRTPHNRIEQMAAAYIAEIKSVQPEGPYFIAGVCTGGTISYEMACQLTAEGSQVGFLGLLDSTARPTLEDTVTSSSNEDLSTSALATFYQKYIKHNFALRGLNNLWGVILNPHVPLQNKISFTRDMFEQLAQKIGRKLESVSHSRTQGMSYEMRRSQVFDAGEEALSYYVPPVYDGSKVLLIRATHNPEHVVQNYRLGWDEFVTQEIEVDEIPADQTTLLFEPHIRTLAAKLNSCLMEAYDSCNE